MGVWSEEPAFELQGLTLPQHQARVNSIQTLAEAEVEMEQALVTARWVRARLFRQLYALNIRVAQAIGALLSEESELHGQLSLVYAAGAGRGQAVVLKRARLVAGVWTDFNAQRAAEVPSKPAFTIRYTASGLEEDAVEVTVADFATLIITAQAAQTGETNAQRDLSDAKAALRATERRVDRDNKRWYQVWTRVHLAGTVKGDAARSLIPTEKGTKRPKPLPILRATAQPGGLVEVTYAKRGGAHATTKELRWRIDAESDYTHATPLERPAQTVGPFAAGSTVTFLTSMANSRPGEALSEPVAVSIPG